MHFEWDAAKNLANIRKHGIDFNDIPDFFQHPTLTLRDDRVGYTEERWISVGWIKAFVGVVVYTERSGDVIRIISARKATRQESGHYVKNIKN